MGSRLLLQLASGQFRDRTYMGRGLLEHRTTER
jgi:hypothetical protein